MYHQVTAVVRDKQAILQVGTPFLSLLLFLVPHLDQ